MSKEQLRKTSKELPGETRTYRPDRDWPKPVDDILKQIPPEALNPPGESPHPSPSNEPGKGGSADKNCN